MSGSGESSSHICSSVRSNLLPTNARSSTWRRSPQWPAAGGSASGRSDREGRRCPGALRLGTGAWKTIYRRTNVVGTEQGQNLDDLHLVELVAGASWSSRYCTARQSRSRPSEALQRTAAGLLVEISRRPLSCSYSLRGLFQTAARRTSQPLGAAALPAISSSACCVPKSTVDRQVVHPVSQPPARPVRDPQRPAEHGRRTDQSRAVEEPSFQEVENAVDSRNLTAHRSGQFSPRRERPSKSASNSTVLEVARPR